MLQDNPETSPKLGLCILARTPKLVNFILCIFLEKTDTQDPKLYCESIGKTPKNMSKLQTICMLVIPQEHVKTWSVKEP